MQRHDPVHRESVPANGGDSPPLPVDYIRPADLHPATMALLKRSLERNRRRRKMFRTSHLRVCLDGEERWQCALGASVYEPFSVPLSATYLEIIGEDIDGPLLLAVFPLPEPAWVEADGAQHLVTTLEGGQTVTLDIALRDGICGEARAYVVEVAYSESPAM
jgi:hypothetical protein